MNNLEIDNSFRGLMNLCAALLLTLGCQRGSGSSQVNGNGIRTPNRDLSPGNLQLITKLNNLPKVRLPAADSTIKVLTKEKLEQTLTADQIRSVKLWNQGASEHIRICRSAFDDLRDLGWNDYYIGYNRGICKTLESIEGILPKSPGIVFRGKISNLEETAYYYDAMNSKRLVTLGPNHHAAWSGASRDPFIAKEYSRTGLRDPQKGPYTNIIFIIHQFNGISIESIADFWGEREKEVIVPPALFHVKSMNLLEGESDSEPFYTLLVALVEMYDLKRGPAIPKSGLNCP